MEIENKFNRIEKDVWFFPALFVLYAFFSFWLICSLDSTLYIPITSSIKMVVALLTIAMFAFYVILGKISFDNSSMVFCVFPLGYYLLSYFNHYDNNHIISIVGSFILILFLVLDKNTKCNIYFFFRKVIYVMALLGIFCYAAYILHLPLPHIRTEYYGDENWYYIYYYFSVLVDSEGQIRLCGLFNEPGFFGTILGLMLCVDIENSNSKFKENAILYIAGFLSFSLAFFLIVGIGYLLKQIAKPSKWLYVVLIVFLYLYILPYIHTGYDWVDHLIQRTTITETGLSGDNRSTYWLDMMFVQTIFGDNSVWGHGMGYVASFEMNTSSYKTIIVDNGIGGFLFFYVLLLLVAFVKYKNIKDAYPLLIVFFLNVYQRPQIYNIVCFIVLFGGLSVIENKRRISKLYYK